MTSKSYLYVLTIYDNIQRTTQASKIQQKSLNEVKQRYYKYTFELTLQ